MLTSPIAQGIALGTLIGTVLGLNLIAMVTLPWFWFYPVMLAQGGIAAAIVEYRHRRKGGV